MDAENVLYPPLNNDVPSLYRETFNDPKFNPRWESGLIEADCLAILDVSDTEPVLTNTISLECRNGGDSFHVDIAIDEDGEETENLSHKDLEEGYLEEHEET